MLSNLTWVHRLQGSNLNHLRARLHVSVHGIHGAIARTNSSNQIVPTTVRLHVGLREKETKQYTISSGWNETFSFDLTYHEHLFWNLQVDVYQSKSLRPSSHAGRYESRLSQVPFDNDPNCKIEKSSQPQIIDLRSKTCPTINFRLLGLKTAIEEESKSGEAPIYPVVGGVIISLFYERLRSSLEVAKEAEAGNEPVIRDSSYWSTETNELIEPSPTCLDGNSCSTISSANSSVRSATVEITDYTVFSGDVESYKHKVLSEQKTTWFETISRMVLSEEDHQSFRELQFIASGFGQGLDLSAFSMGVAFVLLQRFYDLQPLIFTNNLVLKKEDLDLPRYLYRYTLGTTGWMGLNFFGKGKGFIADAWRDQANLRALLDYLSIPESDLLVYNLEEGRIFRPGFYVCIDRAQSAVILSIRGTMCVRDGMTDLVCEYVPFKDGLAHSGFLKSSQWFFENIGRQLLMFAEEYGLENIYCLGHSLGGSTAALTCMHMYDFFMSRDEGWPMCSFDSTKRINLHCYAFGTPPTVSQTIANRYDHLITIFINGEDVVPNLSFGSVLDFHLMVSYAASICSASHLFQAIESTPIMDRLQHCRNQIVASSNRLNPKLFILGKIHHIVSLEGPNHQKYRLVETVGPERFQEIKTTSKAFRHHMPDRYEVALNEAYATFLKSEREERINMADAALAKSSSPPI